MVPNHGRQQIQPIYIDDLAHLVASLIHTFPIQPLRILAVGSAPLTLNEFLQFLRKALNLPRALSLSIPYFIMKRIARWGNSIEHIPLNTEMLTMLEAGSTENSMSVWDQKTREVTPYENFIRQEDSWARLWQARFRWFVPTARACVALVWLVTGLVSLGIYPVKDSLQILKQAGLSGGYAMSSLVFASILDLVLGATSLIPKLTIRRFSYLFQMVTMTTYMLIITIRLPEFWLHPFGPLLKNLPLFALTLFLYIYDSKMNIPKPKLKTDHDNLPPC